MKVRRMGSDKYLSININKYAIDWENDGASKIEKKFMDLIYPYWKNSIILYQYKIPGTLLRVDFINCNKRLAVEIDGPQHNEFNKHFHANSRVIYLNAIDRDMDKEDWFVYNNIKYVRLDQNDLNNFSKEYISQKFDINLF